ncbi:sentrin-specific protease 2-like isoform X2 [Larus michahellis]|uniref:sentrin-specific protease 2-like isoform X2 n=1 Tax=Larus michahellis TaxID=119627 RepID=UPI003D9BB640
MPEEQQNERVETVEFGICTPVEDPDEPPAKKRRTDFDDSEPGEKPEEVSSVVKLQRKATKRRRASVRDDASTFSEPPAKRPRWCMEEGGTLRIVTSAAGWRGAYVRMAAGGPRRRPRHRCPPPRAARRPRHHPRGHPRVFDVSENGQKPGEVATVGKLQSKATKRPRASVSDDAPSRESGEESIFSEPPAKRPRWCMEEGGTLRIVTDALRSLSLCDKTIPRLSTSQRGKQDIKPASGSVLTPRPPIKERAAPERSTLEASKMGRLFCTAEEDVQRGEKMKHQKPLEPVKEEDAGSRPNPEPTRVEAYSKEPVMTDPEETKGGGDVYPYATLRTGITWVDVCCPEPSQGNVVTRGSPPAEECLEEDGAVKQAVAVAGEQRGAQIAEGVLRQVPLAPAQAKKSPALAVKGKKVIRLRRIGKDFTPLTEAMEREVIAALGKGEPEEILSSAFNLKVTREDIHTLRNGCWLNDEVINFYMGLVMERSKKAGYPSVHAFSSLFYEKLASGGYRTVRRLTRCVDVFQKDIIFVPINLSLHWALAVIDMRKKTVKYFDSWGQEGGDKICETLLKYLQEESREKRHVKLSVSEWTVHSMEPHEIPQQSNGSDCGVFTCKYADYISREKPMTFTQIHMPYFRERMVWEILHQELL